MSVPMKTVLCDCVCHTKDYDVGPRGCDHCRCPSCGFKSGSTAMQAEICGDPWHGADGRER